MRPLSLTRLRLTISVLLLAQLVVTSVAYLRTNVKIISYSPAIALQSSSFRITNRLPVVNEGGQITLTVVDNFGNPVTGLTFQSGSPEVATVDQTGTVFGVMQGFATITASNGSFTDSVTVVVTRLSKTQGARIQGDIKVE